MEYQIEILRKNLGDKVKGVHLGSTYNVKDPISRISEKKPLKPFLVNQTSLILERGQLRIPSKTIDEVIHRQMTNYQVVKVSTVNGTPIYTNIDEHALDALEFALFAFIEEKPNIANTLYNIEYAKGVRVAVVKQVDPLSQTLKNGFKDGNLSNNKLESNRIRKVRIGHGQKNNSSSWGSRGSSSFHSNRGSF